MGIPIFILECIFKALARLLVTIMTVLMATRLSEEVGIDLIIPPYTNTQMFGKRFPLPEQYINHGSDIGR